ATEDAAVRDGVRHGGINDEGAVYGHGGGGEEVAAAFYLVVGHQAQVGLVNQGGGLERLPGASRGPVSGQRAGVTRRRPGARAGPRRGDRPVRGPTGSG